MKILAINNYSLDGCLENARKGVFPFHHCWGIDYLMKQGDVVETMLYENKGKSTISRKLYDLIFNIKILLKIYRYDAIIAFFNPAIYIIAYLKQLRLIPWCPKLFTLVHHAAPHSFLSNGYDSILFLSEKIKEKIRESYPNLCRLKFVNWGGANCVLSTVYQQQESHHLQ